MVAVIDLLAWLEVRIELAELFLNHFLYGFSPAITATVTIENEERDVTWRIDIRGRDHVEQADCLETQSLV